jgi:hypothetical protein
MSFHAFPLLGLCPIPLEEINRMKIAGCAYFMENHPKL